jgi:tRNA (guanosine-2'-O-)-methyltransferase
MSKGVVRKLQPLISEARRARIEAVLSGRIGHIRVLLESPYDHGNITAIMRTCEGLGIQNLHLAVLPEKFKLAKKISQGAHKWLSMQLHDTVEGAVNTLKGAGYRLVCADFGASTTLADIDTTEPIAVAFGSELEGVSPELIELCDETFHIPMVGYTQSLNLSCAAAIVMMDLTTRYRRDIGRSGDLSDRQKTELRELFYRRAVREGDLILEHLEES